MTMRKKFDGLGEKLRASAAERSPDAPATGYTTPRTAPGALFAYREQMQAASDEVAGLQARLDEFTGGVPTRRLDPTTVRASALANRHDLSYADPHYQTLKADIELAGGNVQAIKVRPLPADPGQYEIVFGHRRHRACLELGLPVLAVIEELTDTELFLEMDRENREREDLSPYELGKHYQRALALKLWPSMRQMAAALGVSHQLASKALVVAELPEQVIAAFSSPLEIQYRWAAALRDQLDKDSERVLGRAAELLTAPRPGNAREVLERLLGAKPDAPAGIVVDGKKLADIQQSGKRVSVRFASGAIAPNQLPRLKALLSDFLRTVSEDQR